MADEVKRTKAIRVSKMSSFTRKKNHLQQLLDGGGNPDKLKKVYEDLEAAYKVLEQAQEEVLIAIGEDLLETEIAYMDIPAATLADMDVKVSTAEDTHMQSQREQQTRQDAALNEAKQKKDAEDALTNLRTNIDAFGKPSTVLTQLSADNRISPVDMRSEMTKVEEAFSKLLVDKTKVLSLDSSIDLVQEEEKLKLVSEELETCKRIALQFLKDTPVPAATISAEPTGGGRAATSSFSTTKRETVMLPKFSGEEKSAYLEYPVWKKQWESHIVEYEVKYRATMLLNHLDVKAKEQIIGLENDYENAMKSLDKYYNDAKKIVKACLDEIKGHAVIHSFDYKSLVAFKKCLVNNFTRLKACDLDHELSNTAALGVLVRKLPIQEAVDWQKYLAKKDRTDQAKPFPSFLSWLEEAGAYWELLAASGTGVKGKGGATQVHHSFFNDGEEAESSKQSKPCFKCGEMGHWKRDCKKGNTNGGNSKSTGGGQAVKSKAQKDRASPKNKKFHCALHKGLPGRMCSTWSCTGLKYTPFDERVKLMRENGDCEMCCGDCPKGNCEAKFKRTCGGGKEGRGCGANHLGHELWCQRAKLCMSTQVETVLRSSGEENGVLLQIMRIPSISPNKAFETVLWDSACSAIFVRHDHAKEMGFPFKNKRLRVSMLGGHLKEIDGVIYQCKVRDQNGKVYEFEAHGLDEVTGEMGRPISKEIMRQLFPNVIGAHSMSGVAKVDYLIGLSQASWHPQRTQKACGGGDFWLWENAFGSSLGGSHPLVDSYTNRSDSLYTVLKTVVHNEPFADSLKIPSCSAFSTKVSPLECSDFFNTEQLGTIVEPKCGSCKCGRCPIPGSRYSFREETELRLIEEKLVYDDTQSCWISEYPYLFSREVLKGSKEVAYKSMLQTERALSRNSVHGEVYHNQIMDMVNRGVARVVPPDELGSGISETRF